MKKLLVIAAAVMAAGCASTVPFTIKSAPPGRTRQQIQLDDLECTNMSRTNGPWVYGIGTAIMRSESAKKYKECMSARGYVVERSEGNTSHPSSSSPESNPTPVRAPVAQIPRSTHQAPATTERAAHANSPRSPAERLKELDELYKSGLITKKEYDTKREEILSAL